MIGTIIKISSKLATIFAINFITWEFVISSFLALFGLLYDSEIIFYAQLVCLIVVILAWIWLHYRSKQEMTVARRSII